MIIVTIYPHDKRVSYISKVVLGYGYRFDIALADSPYTLDEKAEVEKIEKDKIRETKKILSEITLGDDKTICKKANKELIKRKL